MYTIHVSAGVTVKVADPEEVMTVALLIEKARNYDEIVAHKEWLKEQREKRKNEQSVNSTPSKD